MAFIPANESPFFKRLFRMYVKGIFQHSFKNVWIHQEYQPGRQSRTIYFMNHTTWWDGLIPFLLNEYRFNQQARAFMDHEQMQKYPFFKWMGVFSIDADNRKHTLQSLRYAVKSLQRPNASLFIFPQGEIQPITRKPQFKSGLGWLYKQYPHVDVVPIGVHHHTVRHRKPELHLWIDHPVELSKNGSTEKITSNCEEALHSALDKLIETAGFDDALYKHF